METKAAPSAQQASAWKYPLQFLCNWASSILEDKTGDLLEYRHLLKNPKYKDMWSQSFSKEIRQLATTTKTITFLKKNQKYHRHNVKTSCTVALYAHIAPRRRTLIEQESRWEAT
jgi:hypothetical protein